MAESLRLRETTTDAGLRATSGEGALRQDGFTPTTAKPADTSTHVAATLVDYNTETKEWTVEVGWSVSSSPTTATPSAGLNIREAQIRYSWESYPEFWTDEQFLDNYTTNTESIMPNPIRHTVTSTESLSNWLYYSLFYKYSDSDGNIYTERMDTASVLIPTYYDSGSSMWKRVTPYYRALDTTGHLEKYIRAFGWEADQCRSLIDEIMHLKDARRVHHDSLDRLANSVGVIFNIQEVRPHQLRELLGDSHK